jgi:hypothetical protein
MTLLDKLFQTLSFSKLTDLSQEASLRLFKSFKCYCSKDVETIIAYLDLANDRKQRLDAWMHQEFGLCRPCCLPFANTLNLLEWLDDAFEWAEKDLPAEDYYSYGGSCGGSILRSIKASTGSLDGKERCHQRSWASISAINRKSWEFPMQTSKRISGFFSRSCNSTHF